MSIFQHLADPELFGPWFRDPKSWRAWRVVLKALFGDRMTASERKLFTQTNRPHQTADQAGLRVLVDRRASRG